MRDLLGGLGGFKENRRAFLRASLLRCLLAIGSIVPLKLLPSMSRAP